MRTFWVIAVALSVAVADRLSKVWSIEYLGDLGAQRAELGPFVTIVHARNTGVNFGVFASDSPWQPYLLAGFAVAVSAALLVWALRAADRRVALGAAILIGGALGNAYDRVVEGAVIDFLNVTCCGIANPYAFNGADTAIFLGAALIVIATWRQ